MKHSIKFNLTGGVILFCLAMCLTSCEGALDDVLGEWSRPTPGNNNNTNTTPSTSSTYLKWDDGTKALVATALPESFKKMSASETTWSGTYIVDEDVEITDDVTLGGDVDLIILDGKTLSLASDKKIDASAVTYTLNIYSQSNGDGAGTLTVSTTTAGAYPIATNGTLNIHSGIVNATAIGATAEGIYVDTEFNVYGATVNVSATLAGIMVGGMSGGDLNIYGGTIDAKSTGNSGIGCYGDINITGGTVKATSTQSGYGIIVTSGGLPATKGKLNITGGNVTATGGPGGMGAGISTNNDITIDDGTVTANGAKGMEGIFMSGGKLIVNDGTLIANGGEGDNAVNGQSKGGDAIQVMTLEINGGTITATGGNGDPLVAGVGGNGITGTTVITDCVLITATGGTKSLTAPNDGDGFDNASTITIPATLKYSEDGTDKGAGTGAAINISAGVKVLIVQPNS